MPFYVYKATDPSGKIVEGSLEAAGENAVVSGLHDMGYIPISIRPAGKDRFSLNTDVSAHIRAIFSRVSPKDVVIFTQDLSSLLEAGLPVDRALSILIDSAEKEKFREVIQDVLKTVEGGSYLSDALAKYPRIFSTLYVNLVRAGEAGGVLEAVLTRLGVYLASSQDLRDHIKSVMIYPAFLALFCGFSVIFLLTFVLPRFSVIFSDMGRTMPWSTQLLLGISGGLRSYWWVIIVVIGMGYYFLKRYAGKPEGRLKIDQHELNLPVVGELIKKIEVARFARNLGTLTESGVPILRAMKLVNDIIGNRVISISMAEVYERVKEGEKLSRPLADTGIFPSMAIQMITVGEETGRMAEMLLRVADNYEKVVKNLVERFTSLLGPILILLMGLVVAFIVVSMLLAIFSMNELPF